MIIICSCDSCLGNIEYLQFDWIFCCTLHLMLIFPSLLIGVTDISLYYHYASHILLSFYYCYLCLHPLFGLFTHNIVTFPGIIWLLSYFLITLVYFPIILHLKCIHSYCNLILICIYTFLGDDDLFCNDITLLHHILLILWIRYFLQIFAFCYFYLCFLQRGDWKALEFKEYNLNAQVQPNQIGYLQPLLEA